MEKETVLPFIGVVTKQVGFGKTSKKQSDLRETKHHFIDSDGTKFSKKTGNSLDGYKYKGIFIGEKLDLDSVKTKNNDVH